MSSAQEQLWVQGQLRKDVERWVSVLSGERPDDAPARTNFDLYLFAQVGFLLADVEQELIGIAEWEQAIRDIERCINNNPSVRAFEERLRRAGQAPLASRTFLDLAKRQVRRKANPRKANQSIPDSQRLPDFNEGCAVAKVLLAYDTAKDRWKRDLRPDELSKRIAADWLCHRSPGGLEFLIRCSEESRIWWDALEQIGDMLGGEDDLPDPLARWYFQADKRHRRPPPEIAAPPHRPTTVGYMIRDLRIRETIRVLAQLGMPPTGGPDSGCSVVAAVLALQERTVRGIWMRSDMTIDESFTEYLEGLSV